MTTDPAEWIDDEPRAPDRFNLALAVAALALLSGAAWLRFGSGLFPKSTVVGEPMPPTRLSRLHGADSRLFLGMEGRVLWLVFLSSEPADALPVLPGLATAWDRLKDDSRFDMAVAAADSQGPARVRAALEPYRRKLPLYLAGAEAPRSFGVEPSGGPWHFLIDSQGRVAAVARGSAEGTVDRLAKMASDWLEALAPPVDLRFRLVLTAAGVLSSTRDRSSLARPTLQERHRVALQRAGEALEAQVFRGL